ncbi:respiratory nitrate reductase subunit gamma, partial [Thermodesulfobacteriota bacterium]
MIDKLWYFVMVPMVYFSVVWCVVWIILRIAGVLGESKLPPTLRIFPEGKDPEDWNTGGLPGSIWDALTMPSVRRYHPLLWAFLMVFHISLAILLLSHLDLLPGLNIMSADSPNMIGNGAVAVILIACVLYFFFRRFRSPIRELSVPSDYLLLFLLFLIILTGAVISWGNSWSEDGFVITKQDFGLYLQGLVGLTFADPREVLTGAHYSVVGTHVLLANLFLLVLPFSKLVHVVFAVPLNAPQR